LSISILLLIMIIGGAKINPLYPFHLERPFVAEMFAWIGFGYFWYRINIYGPISLYQIFKNEIILSHVIKYDPGTYTMYNLSTFVGTINVQNTTNDRTAFSFSGTTEASGNAAPSGVVIPLKLNVIFSKYNYLKNIFRGKVVTDFYMPHILAAAVLSIGTYNRRVFFPDIYFNVMGLLLAGNAYYILLSILDKNNSSK